MAYFRCNSVGGKLKSLTISSFAIACRMAGDTSSHNWMQADIGVPLQTMIDLGFTTVTVNANVTSNISVTVFGVDVKSIPATVNLTNGKKDGISGRRLNMRGFGAQDGYQDSISITATFKK